MYKILAVDDAKDTLMLLEFDLVEEGYEVITAENGEAALKILSETNIDLILLDMYMPGISGLALLEKIKKQEITAEIPVIMLSASDDEDQVVSALELGANDYVTKPYIAKVLLARIGTSFRLMEKNLALEALAKTDPLTGLDNRRSFETEAIKSLSLAKRTNQEVIMVMLDIDLFKLVNDQYGHEVGDKVLIDFASQLTLCFRNYDPIGRIGGEEFAVCMPNTSMYDAMNACERLREKVKKIQYGVPGSDECFSITVSIGVALGYGSSLHYDSLLRAADKALYQAKDNGRDQTVNANLLENTDIDSFDKNTTMLEKNNTEESDMSADNEKFPGINYEIGVSNVLGDGELFQDILVMFYEDHAGDGDKLSATILANDIDASKHIAHTLKGVSSSIGAMDLFEVTKVLDTALNESQGADLSALCEPVANELKKVISGLETNLSAKIA